jgi:multidrug efflux system membrane fusion protein
VPPALVSVAPVTSQTIPIDLTLVGTSYPYQTVEIKSRLDSQITAVHFKDGDTVKQGQLLFTLDDRILRARELELLAQLKSGEATLKNAKQEYQRYRKLGNQGFAAKQKLQSTEADLKRARATQQATQAALDAVRVQLSYTHITAPIDGRTGTITITTGNTVKANDTLVLVTINQLQPIYVQVAIPQQYFPVLKNAQTVAATATYTDGTIASHGTLAYIDNTIDTQTGTFVARAVFPNTDEKLWAGMFVNLTLNLEQQQNALTIPARAVVNSQQGTLVFVYDAQQKTAHKRVVTVERTVGDVAVIKTGLKAQEQVITDGLLRVKEGGAVVLAGEKKAAKP